MIKGLLAKNINNSAHSTLDPYKNTLEKINQIKLDTKDDTELRKMSVELADKACEGISTDSLLIAAFALVREAVRRVLGMNAFDAQIIAGIALHLGRLIEMQTGEGKTLAAVFPAYLDALTGQGVHILTFNDYLARRDAGWMGPVFEFLGLTVGFIQEDMDRQERKKAYACDVTYVTAREAGFDYLRDFLCYDKEDIVQRPFKFAIVDEADSIMIDEARVPLVIAVSEPETETGLHRTFNIVRQLELGIDYDTDEYSRNVYLTDAGIRHVENSLSCGNLYAEENFEVLTELNSALHAEVLLKRDIDYIVRDGRVELVDEFTGRIAENRHWPDGIQSAVEAKEGVVIQSKGRIMSSITLQGFLEFYPKIAGMTATAEISSEEFKDFYGLDIVKIPPNRKCVRVDYPDMVFTHKEAKYRALIAEIIRVNSTGRPILIGTTSIEESNDLALKLRSEGIDCQVLNAKNDELEAQIIAHAGALGAVTVSTNMAGRGTDIRLGGSDEQGREKAVALGGLYVIGINRHESRRIDNQLRGRSGRQGDHGSSRFFVSLEDDLIKRYGINKMKYRPGKQEAAQTEIADEKLRHKIAQVQRIIEGQNYDIRRTLWRYSYIVEKQRRLMCQRRMDIILERSDKSSLYVKAPELYSKLCSVLDKDALDKLEIQVWLFQIDNCWADYLAQIAYLREGIHLVNIGGQNPLEVYLEESERAFKELQKNIDENVISTFNSALATKDGFELLKEGIKGPSSTWTYLINDNPFSDDLGLLLVKDRNIAFAVLGPLLLWPFMLGSMIYRRFFTKGKLVE